MRHHEDAEIIKQVQKIFDEEHEKNYIMGWGDGEIEVLENNNNIVNIKISCMYQSPSPTLEVMQKLSDYFETKNINDDDAFAESGCETCDYGSSYGYTLSIRPDATA